MITTLVKVTIAVFKSERALELFVILIQILQTFRDMIAIENFSQPLIYRKLESTFACVDYDSFLM